ncbi:MAG: hypothetical protein Q9185_004542 [Variospora sp. 1 TL-2023]
MGSIPGLVGHNRLQLSLNSPPDDRPVYLPGDPIQGDISLRNPHHAAGVDASISFTGLSRVRFKEKGRLFAPVHSHEEEFLGWWKTNLACTKRHDALVWKFNFWIPSEERATRSSLEGDFSNRAVDALSPILGHLTYKKGDDKYAAVTYTFYLLLQTRRGIYPEHRWDANLLVPELNAGLPVTPSFMTRSLSHTHTLRVRGQMDIDTEKIRFNVEKPLIVLSQYSREDPLAFSSKSLSPSGSDHIEHETSAPPPYAEASSGATTLPNYVNAITEKL